uniref:Ig-like domain-containing protein n=1 Tax=Acanthochromis polyacanthus TaxID=80966 RepID=A0A3Q1F4F6_9TELE
VGAGIQARSEVSEKPRKSCRSSNWFCCPMYPPVFVSKPDPMTLYVGKQAVFQCSLTGSSPMDVVWHKDNIAISSEGNYVMKCEKNKYSLLIKSLELTNQGVYLCKASNSVGTATSTTELRVINRPSFVKSIEPASAAVNDPLRLECQVDEDTGVTVTWTRDGKKVHQSMECKLSFEDKVAVLEIPKSKLKDSGKYVCTATNEAGSSSCEAVVTVQEPPFVRKELQTVEAVKGAAAQLECEITGTAPFEISWLKNKKTITSDQKYTIISQDSVLRLEIQTFESADIGDYQCVISNDVGKVTTKASARLKGQ